jgi:RimJ/RimL family protein N-acetyltransferase
MALGQIQAGETKRLLLRPLALDDAAQIQELFPHWEIVRHLMNRVPWPYPPDGAEFFVREVALPAMERGDEWHWSLRLKTAPEQLIGMISLVRNAESNRGFWMGIPWQGQGLMSEAADWVTDYWFNVLGYPVLRVAKSGGNPRSRRISEKQKMRLVGHKMMVFLEGQKKADLWELSAEEWNAR